MNPSAIKFGTDGWRALIAQDYTFDNVRALAQALAVYLHESQPDKARNGVAIGYDTRFLSREFAQATAETLAAAGIPAQIANHAAPTPAIAWATRSQNLASGIMITASHNPPQWNGFKFFTPRGGPADKDASNQVEAILGREDASQREDALGREDASQNGQAASVQEFDPRPALFEQLKRVVDFDLLRRVKGRAVCDCVHGTGTGYVDALLRECGWEVETIRANPDPMFGGILPDPANPKCHVALQNAVKEHQADMGLANDPDADRFGIVDARGDYITPNQVLPLLYVHLLETRGLKGPVARTVATTHLLDAIAKQHGQQVIQTPVGFKWIGAAIEEQGAILGGEESGGLSITGHLPGKDGVLADLLMCEVWATHQKPLGQVFAQLMEKYGTFVSNRIDLHLEPAQKDALLAKMRGDTPSKVAGSKVSQVVTLDGIKLDLEDGSWLLMRPSGTEPLVRVYMEARSPQRLEELAQAARAMS